MKISLINGSPKAKRSASGIILNELQALLSPNDHIVNIHTTKHRLNQEDYAALQDSDVIVFAFPLYVDALPSHLISYLIQVEEQLKNTAVPNNCTVYAIVNCGFYEGSQNVLALDIMKCWCEKAGFVWGGGLGVGGGGMMSMLASVPAGKGPKKNFSQALRTLSDRISRREIGGNLCFSPNFPRFLYKMAAEMGWRKAVKDNGLKTHDLWNRQV